MKLQIDTKAKTIKVDENVKFSELIKVLKKILPREWQDYSLAGNEIIYWYNPITWYPHQPWRIGDVTYTSEGESVPATVTCYNVEVMN